MIGIGMIQNIILPSIILPFRVLKADLPQPEIDPGDARERRQVQQALQVNSEIICVG